MASIAVCRVTGPMTLVLMSLPRFPGHLDCGDSVAQGGVRDGNEVPSGVSSTGGRARAAA